MQILGSPAGVHAFWSASASESTRTTTPNATHTYEGRVVRRSRALLSFRKHAAGKIYASAVAEMPPVISSVTPRSHVMRDTGCVCQLVVLWWQEGGWTKCARTQHGRKNNDGGEEDVALHAKSFVREEILLDHLATHEELQRERREHV